MRTTRGPDDLLTIDQAAAYLGVGRSAVYTQVIRGRLRAWAPGWQPRKKGMPIRLDRADLDAYRTRVAQPPGFTLQDLIAAGMIQPPVEIEHQAKGHRVVATITPDAEIVVEGHPPFATLSAAASHVMDPVPAETQRNTRRASRQRQINGWRFWRVRATDGTLRSVDDLRQRLGDAEQERVR